MIDLKKAFQAKTSVLDPDLPETTILVQEVIRNKKMLRNFYLDQYHFFKSHSSDLANGIRLEIGSGPGFIKEVIPDTVTSDIQDLPHVDKTVSALQLPFPDRSIRDIFMINVLHHLITPKDFFREVQRCLMPGGRLLLVEPANTAWGRFIYRNFHHEPFDPTVENWELPKKGPLSSANIAMPWIIFVRDRTIFESEFPKLKVEDRTFCHPLKYLLSGGLSRRQLVPDKASTAIDVLEEKLLKPFGSYLGMFMRISITKMG